MAEAENNNVADKDLPPWLQAVPDDIDDGASKLTGRNALILTGGLSALVVVGFVSLIVYFGIGSAPDGEIPHVAALAEPYRSKPDDPGGMPVPHQDKVVLEAAAGQAPVDGASEIGDQPEQPLEDIASAVAKPKTITDLIESSADTPPSTADSQRENAPQAGASNQPVASQSQPVADTATKPAEPAKSTPVPEEKPEQEAAVPAAVKPQPAGLSSSVFAVQLGAFSQRDSAVAAWRRARNAVPELLRPLSPDYQSVATGGRTLVRLRTGPFENRASADQACLAIRAAELACIVVPPVGGGDG